MLAIIRGKQVLAIMRGETSPDHQKGKTSANHQEGGGQVLTIRRKETSGKPSEG